MGRNRRLKSEADIYHIYTRGVNGEPIFTDDADRKKLCYVIGDALDGYGGELYAWCLMPNHVHFVLRNDFDAIPQQIATLKSRYARYFNDRHGRYGHLFQGRYGCKPVNTDAYLLTVVRYVHLNPVAANISRTCDYPWSSYRDYVSPGARHRAAHHRPDVSTEPILQAFGGPSRFASAHALAAPTARKDPAQLERDIEDAETLDSLEGDLGPDPVARIRSASRPERDRLLRNAKARGYSISRIARATGCV